MSPSRRTIWAASLLALTSLFVIGCGGGTGSGAPSAGYGANRPKVTIQVWYMPNGGDPIRYFDAEARAFEAVHPNIQVRGMLLQWGDAFGRITTALTGGTGPDVIQLGTTWVGAFSKTGGLHAFTPAEIAGLGGRSAFVPAAWASCCLVGSAGVTAIPWFIDTRAIYYRKDILQKLNIDPATAFTDWNALEATLGKIQQSGLIQAFGVPGKQAADVVHNFAPFIWDAGGDYVNAAGTAATIDQPASIDGVTEYETLAGRYVDPAVLQDNNYEVEAQFGAGKFAVTTDGPWLATQLIEPPEAGGFADGLTARNGFGTAPMPAGPKDHKVFFGGSNLAILKSSKQEAAAYEFVRWLTNQGQSTYVSRVGMWPARTLAANASQFAGNEYMNAFKDQLQFGKAYPMTAAWGPIETAMVKDYGTLWDQVAAAKGPVPRSVVQSDMSRAAQDMNAAIQSSAPPGST